MAGIYSLKGSVKHYDWGGYSFIAALLQVDNPEKIPLAEYWLGIHPLDNTLLEGTEHGIDGIALLRKYLDHYPDLLGKYVVKRFGRLPYLLKILDVRSMLSIQVHPSKKMAEEGFAKENANNIPLDSPDRNYKDNNHKPELFVAMNDFWLLHGFKPAVELTKTLQSVPQLAMLLPLFKTAGYEGLYKRVMTMPQHEVNVFWQSWLNRILPLYKDNKLEKNHPDYWAAAAAEKFIQDGNIDRGIFSIYLFNLVQLKKGEGMFQGAGVPHAYLEGLNVEIMANSDNVLRGGLTSKHIDVNELLKHVKYEATVPEILRGQLHINGEKKYETTAPDFELSCFELKSMKSASFTPVTAEILLITEGKAEISNGTDKIMLEPGNPSAIAFPGHEVHIKANTDATVFRASVPINKGE